MKVRGPKTAPLLESCRPIAVTDTAIIGPEDVLLLEYAYSSKNAARRLGAIFRILATQYGAAISAVSLRHTVLAFLASQLHDAQFPERCQFHQQKARRALLQKLQYPPTIEDADVLTAYLLAETMYHFHSWPEIFAHTNESLSMLRLLSTMYNERPLSELLILLGSTVNEVANYYITAICLQR